MSTSAANAAYPPAWASGEWKFIVVSTPLELTMAGAPLVVPRRFRSLTYTPDPFSERETTKS